MLLVLEPVTLGPQTLEVLGGLCVLGRQRPGSLPQPCGVGGLPVAPLPGGVGRDLPGAGQDGVCGVLRAELRQRGAEHSDGLVVRFGREPRMRPVPVVVLRVAARVGRDVGVVAFAAAGHRDVEVFPVHAWPDQHEAEVGGGALGGVDGQSPAVLAVLGEVVRGQDGPPRPVRSSTISSSCGPGPRTR